MSDPVKAAFVNRSHVRGLIDALLGTGGRVRAIETAVNAWTFEVFTDDIYVVDREVDDTPVGIVRVSCQGVARTTIFLGAETEVTLTLADEPQLDWFNTLVEPIARKLRR